jgi:hypothetical protein
MLSASHTAMEFDLSSTEAYFRLFNRLLHVRSGLWFKKWRAIRTGFNFLKIINQKVDGLLSLDLSTVAQDTLTAQAPKAAELLLLISDLNEFLEKTPVLANKRLKRQTETTLNKFFTLERKLRLAAYPSEIADSNDSELAAFNNTLSRNLLHKTHEL